MSLFGFHLLQHVEQRFFGIGPVVTLEAAEVGYGRFALVALEVGDGAGCLDVDKLLLAQNHASDHFAAMDRAQGGRDDIQPVGLALAFRTGFVVAAHPQRRADRVRRHAE